MAVEEHFRDTKGRRFRVKLFGTQFRAPEALARFTMLLAIAMLIWMSRASLRPSETRRYDSTAGRKAPASPT